MSAHHSRSHGQSPTRPAAPDDPLAVQVTSDLHVDVRSSLPILPVTAPTLIIAGDFCPHVDPRYRDALAAVTSQHRRTIYIAGNHEFYGSPLAPHQALEHMERVCASLPGEVHFLRAHGAEPVYQLPGTDVVAVGATLWTNIAPALSSRLETLLNDFRYIRASSGGAMLDAREMSAMHYRDRDWIADRTCESYRNGLRTLVITHHCPDRLLSIHSDTRTRDGLGPLYYASDMGPAIHTRGVVAWIYGHTHESHFMRLPGVVAPFVTNALGYPEERTGYVAGAGIHLESP